MAAPPNTMYDTLTGVFTRRRGTAVLGEALQKRNSVAVLFLDIDHFKSINDAFGHAVGDQALRFLGQQLKNSVGDQGVVARYGGDEFLVVLPGSSGKQASQIAQRILDDLQKQVISRAYPLHLRTSIGIAVAPLDGHTPEQILKVADERHYLAKASGGHRFVFTRRMATRDLITMPRRPLGPRKQLNELHSKLQALPQHTAAVIRIQSAPQGGASLFLQQAIALARLQGYRPFIVHASPALRLRHLGAISDTFLRIFERENLTFPHYEPPFPIETPADLLQSFRWLAQKTQPPRRLLLAVFGADWLDETSAELLQHVLRNDVGFDRVALVYSTVSTSHAHFRAPMVANISVPPLNKQEVEAWLRHALRWEPCPSLLEWIWEHSHGLPERIQTLLTALFHEGFLQPVSGGWQWFPPSGWEPPQPPVPALADIEASPEYLSLFIGRNGTLYQLRSMLQAFPLVTVTGVTGIGKTRLLQQLVLESQEAFPDGAYYLSLPDTPTPSCLAAHLIRLLNLPASNTTSLALLIAYLRRRRALFVLDDFNGCAEVDILQNILQRSPTTRFVIGSQTPLRLPQEQVLPLSGLSVETNGEGPSPAAYLFYYRLRKHGRHVPHGAPAFYQQVEHICRQASGAPAALNMIASWHKALSLEEIIHRLEAQESVHDHPLTPLMDVFWQALSEDEQQRLVLLTLFHGGITPEAARYIARASLFFLEALADKTYLSQGRDGFFYLPSLLRRYVAEHLPPASDDLAAAQRRHAEWYLRELPRQEGLYTDVARWGFLAHESHLPDVVVAWRWALEHRAIALLSEAAPWVFPSVGESHRFVEAHNLVEETLHKIAAYPETLRNDSYEALFAYLQTAHAEFHFHLGNYQHAHRILESVSPEAHPRLPDLHRAYWLMTGGRLWSAEGEYTRSEALFQQAVEIYERVDVPLLLFDALKALGVAFYYHRAFPQARAALQRALQIARTLQRPKAIAATLNNLGLVAWEEGDLSGGERLLREALEYMQGQNAPNLLAAILDSAGNIAASQGRWREALEYLDRSARLARQTGGQPALLQTMVTMADVWRKLGRTREAATLLQAIIDDEALTRFAYHQAQEILQEIASRDHVSLSWDNMEHLLYWTLSVNRRIIASFSSSPTQEATP